MTSCSSYDRFSDAAQTRLYLYESALAAQIVHR